MAGSGVESCTLLLPVRPLVPILSSCGTGILSATSSFKAEPINFRDGNQASPCAPNHLDTLPQQLRGKKSFTISTQIFSLGSGYTAMEDLPANSSPLSPAEQARIRRERRQAKVKEGGNSRLNRITGTQGQTFRNQETPAARPAQEAAPDPPDIDISAHHYEPKARQRERIGREDISAGTGPPPSSFWGSPLADTWGQQDPLFGAGGDPSDPNLGRLMMENNMFGGQAGGAGTGQEDPMLQMMQQLMGGAGGPDGMGGLGGLGGPGMGTPPPEIQQMQQREKSWGMRWKALHVLSSLCLAVWVLRGTGWGFTGSALERVESTNMTREEAPVIITPIAFTRTGLVLLVCVCANLPLCIAFVLVLYHYGVNPTIFSLLP
ncbi:hypothetical protein C7212DRAFT_342819 [Tuber magnatum]|uniref:Uncharacterized protein n=1 Tax=Tuber magnatum TaxID=42249 RepID=A0A317SWK7_9PEZI|nr:hypothetical protein C7212DRAFT_342819 [Tuber magnatum]